MPCERCHSDRVSLVPHTTLAALFEGRLALRDVRTDAVRGQSSEPLLPRRT